MKTLLLLITIIGFQAWSKPTKKLVCSSGQSYERFSVELDYSGLSSGFHTARAQITDNYAGAELQCVGYELKSISCIGFWFGIASEIAEVKVNVDEYGIVSSRHQTIKGHMQIRGGPWACHLENI